MAEIHPAAAEKPPPLGEVARVKPVTERALSVSLRLTAPPEGEPRGVRPKTSPSGGGGTGEARDGEGPLSQPAADSSLRGGAKRSAAQSLPL